jgi:CRP-like cAMP-binding protein
MATPIPEELLRQNRLLRALSPAIRRRLVPLVELMPFNLKDTLIEHDVPIHHVYFPLQGVVSLVGTLADGTIVEVATIGHEGMVGLPLFLRATTIPFTAFVQIPGEGLRMEAAAFDSLVGEVNSDLHQLLYQYTQALFNQLGQHVIGNRMHPIRQRCARWLLTTHDRMGRDDFLLTHEFLAQMLGVRRVSVTQVAGQLQKAGLIRYHRGHIEVLDRAGLEAASCECYGVIRQGYDLLLGAS